MEAHRRFHAHPQAPGTQYSLTPRRKRYSRKGQNRRSNTVSSAPDTFFFSHASSCVCVLTVGCCRKASTPSSSPPATSVGRGRTQMCTCRCTERTGIPRLPCCPLGQSTLSAARQTPSGKHFSCHLVGLLRRLALLDQPSRPRHGPRSACRICLFRGKTGFETKTVCRKIFHRMTNYWRISC